MKRLLLLLFFLTCSMGAMELQLAADNQAGDQHDIGLRLRALEEFFTDNAADSDLKYEQLDKQSKEALSNAQIFDQRLKSLVASTTLKHEQLDKLNEEAQSNNHIRDQKLAALEVTIQRNQTATDETFKKQTDSNNAKLESMNIKIDRQNKETLASEQILENKLAALETKIAATEKQTDISNKKIESLNNQTSWLRWALTGTAVIATSTIAYLLYQKKDQSKKFDATLQVLSLLAGTEFKYNPDGNIDFVGKDGRSYSAVHKGISAEGNSAKWKMEDGKLFVKNDTAWQLVLAKCQPEDAIIIPINTTGQGNDQSQRINNLESRVSGAESKIKAIENQPKLRVDDQRHIYITNNGVEKKIHNAWVAK